MMAVGAVAAMGTAVGPAAMAQVDPSAAVDTAAEAYLVIGYRPGAASAELIPVHAQLGARVVRNIAALHAAVVALPLDTTAAASPLHTTLFGDEAAAAVALGNRTTPSPSSPSAAAAAHSAADHAPVRTADLAADADRIAALTAFAAARYGRLSGVAYVEADIAAGIDAPVAAADDAAARAAVRSSVDVDDRPAANDLTTGDPYASQQWHLEATRLPEAWSLVRADGILIAVVDTGVEASHPDLATALLPGWNARDGSADTRDDHGHGTAIAGVIAAGVGNGLGVAGAAPGARLLPVKALGADGTGWMSDVAAGIVWATDHGARVIVVAAGSRAPLRLLADAVAYAAANGALVVAAAGNAGADAVDHPAADPGALAVAAVDAAGGRSAWSNHGAAVRILAPGEDILTTALSGGYARASGTSLSAGIVGGVAALLYAQTPDASPAAIAGRLLDSAAPGGRFAQDPGDPRRIVDARAAAAERADGADEPSARLPGYWRKQRPVWLPAVYR
ncbi:MAG: S8 family serine peptidase [Ardenticatenales bacterium]